jgi:peptide/nickel transport system substrate-binding protein
VAQLVAKDWEKVGIKTIIQIRERALHFKMRDANDLMTEIWNDDTTAFPFTGNAKVDVRNSVILTLGPLYTQWFNTKGKEGVEPTAEIKKIVELVDTARTVGTEGQIKAAQELFKIWADQIYEIGIVGLTPMIQGVVVVNNKMKNVPAQLGNDWPLRTPGNARPEQFFYQR